MCDCRLFLVSLVVCLVCVGLVLIWVVIILVSVVMCVILLVMLFSLVWQVIVFRLLFIDIRFCFRFLLKKNLVLVKCGWIICLQFLVILVMFFDLMLVMLMNFLVSVLVVFSIGKNFWLIFIVLISVFCGIVRNVCLKLYSIVDGYLIRFIICFRLFLVMWVLLLVLVVVVLILVMMCVCCLLGLISMNVVCRVLMQFCGCVSDMVWLWWK